MKKLIFYILMAFTSHLYGQEYSINVVKVPDYIEFEGMINSKYKINLTLYLEGNRAFGNYYYLNSGERLTLIGFVGIGNNEAEINLIEYEKSDKWPAIYNNIPRAVFSGNVKKDTFNGDWTDLKNNQKLPFTLIRKNLKKKLSSEKYWLETKINDKVYLNEFNTETYYQCEPNIDFKWFLKKGDDNYIVLAVSHFTKCAAYDHGYCGAGVERFIIYQHLNPKTNLQIQQVLQFESCMTSNNLSIIVDDNSFNGNNDDMIKQFNLSNFKSFKLISDSTIYTLQNGNLNLGFILMKKENLK